MFSKIRRPNLTREGRGAGAIADDLYFVFILIKVLKVALVDRLWA
jgi:hypothetical protein